MASCKDCVHYEPCYEYGNILDPLGGGVTCDSFKPKSRFVELPCEVGQTVYVPSGDEESEWIDEYKIKYFYCSSKGVNRFYIECGTMGNNFRPKDIGKTVFLSKEEAEKALAERSK